MPESSSTGSDLAPDGAQATGSGGPADAGAGPVAGLATATRPDPAAPHARPESVWRMRRAAVCVLLGALAFVQDPGMTAIDTKVDLAVNPLGWMARSLHVWDPAGTFGQLQNQAYGYLWPMGPFFALGDLLAVPAWAVQRLWWAALL